MRSAVSSLFPFSCPWHPLTTSPPCTPPLARGLLKETYARTWQTVQTRPRQCPIRLPPPIPRTLQERLLPHITHDMLPHLIGSANDRRSPMGELNWIFTAVTDTIAWCTLSRTMFQKLFRQVALLACVGAGDAG